AHTPSSFEHHVTPSFMQPFSQPSSAASTPTATREAWLAAGAAHPGPVVGRANGAHGASAPDDAWPRHEAARTPVMTTSGAAAAARSSSSQHSTPHGSRGGSIANPRTPGAQGRPPQLAAAIGGDADAMPMDNITYDSRACGLDAPEWQHELRGDDRSGGGGSPRMSVDDDDDVDEPSTDVESKLVRRMSTSQERLEGLLRLLGTYQEHWADHDYVRALCQMLSWPDEWTTSMHMLERLLLEVRID
ncbi:hypothetical protein LPJ61_005578, partial [Coemansia biformis]